MKRLKSFGKLAFLGVVSLLFMQGIVDPALSQAGVEGSILGVVVDESGAVIPGGEVTIENLATGIVRTALTSDSGYFEVGSLQRGRYSVSVALTGFKTWRADEVVVSAGQSVRLRPILQVGTIDEVIIVEETSASVMQTESASVETTIGSKQILELPLNGRNPVELVKLVPGMRFLSATGDADRGATVQGMGSHDRATEFSVDGLTSNSGMDEVGIGIPNVDTVAEFNIQTSNFSAEHGRNPVQVQVVTKSGGNEFHGSAWWFHRNDALDARNTFASGKPKLIRNQFGFSVGGPVIKNKTFFFGSYEGIRIRQERIYNSFTIAPEMLDGDFSSLSRDIIDPQTGEAFQNNQIPEDRIVDSSRFFYDYILLPNSPGQRFRAVAPVPDDNYEFTVRLDHQFNDQHSIYGRYIEDKNERTNPQYRPDIVEDRSVKHQNFGINYNWSFTPTTLLEIGANVITVNNNFVPGSAGYGQNLTQQAGIQGFDTPGRDAFVGLPSVSFSGYSGFGLAWGNPGKLWSNAGGARANISMISGDHSITAGYEYSTRTTWGRHGSCCSRGVFGFSGQSTGDGFADYLLGLIASSSRNYPLQTFGMAKSPYSGLYVNDSWRISPAVTVNLGLRFDYWHEKAFVRGAGATFDLSSGKILAGTLPDGSIDLGIQPIAPILAESTADMWIPGPDAGAPPGLFEAGGYLSPRLGFAWRPSGDNDLVVRAGYGLFVSSFRGNPTASSIVGPPYWTFESTGWSASELQRWETAWPEDPQEFVTPSVVAPDWRIGPAKSHQWNISVQKSLPWDPSSALTVSYIGNKVNDTITAWAFNSVPPGQYDNLQAALPYPELGSVDLYDNYGESWYNGLQLKLNKRFTRGLSYMVSYSFSKQIEENGSSLWDYPTPFAPEGYNRGRSGLDRTHILTANGVWEIPVGRGRSYATDLNPVVNAIVGGWQFSGIYSFISGSPLSFGAPGGTLGNGWGTRANQVGDPKLSNPSPAQWFSPGAFAAPPLYTFGNSGAGLMDGPGDHVLDIALIKNFFIDEVRYLQFRWEMFNAPNHVNYNNPNTTINQGSTGQIGSAGSARQMQLGLKFVF